MLLLNQPGTRLLAVLVLALGTGACAKSPPGVAAAAAAPSAVGCLAAGDGHLQARLRGALVADLDWPNAQMQCEGGMRPDGQGLRVTIAGPLPAGVMPAGSGASGSPLLRFIFGIDLHDAASGAAQALPTNLTVIVEGGDQLYATRGDDKCAVETLARTPIATSGGKLDRVQVRGYCTGPAADLGGTTRVLVPTFAFTAVVHNGDGP